MEDLAVSNVIISTCGILLIIFNLDRLRRLPGAPRLLGSYITLCCGFVASLWDEGTYRHIVNAIEHGCYFISLTLLALWVPILTRNRGTEDGR